LNQSSATIRPLSTSQADSALKPPEPPAAAASVVANAKPRTRAEAFSALIQDQRIGHGAFRLWHCLRDHQNPKSGLCCPGQRRISDQIGCNIHSLKRWTDELVTAGWLVVKVVERGEVFHYDLLDGQSQVLPKTATGGVAKNSNTYPRCGKAQHSVAKNRYTVLRKTATKLRGANAPLENKHTSSPSPAGSAETLFPQASGTEEQKGMVGNW
jgi:Helix-turn-helix domain